MSAISVFLKTLKEGGKILKSKGTKEAAEEAVKLTEKGAKPASELVKGATKGSSTGLKSTKDFTEQMANASSHVTRAELKAEKDAFKVRGALKSVGNPMFEKAGVTMHRFNYSGGKFYDLKRGGVFTRQEFGRLQTHFGNLYGGTKRNYLAWENGISKTTSYLPKFNFSIPTSAAKNTVKGALKSEEKVAETVGKTARHVYQKPVTSITEKVAENAGKEALKTASKGVTKVAEETGKEATKRNYGGWGKLLTYDEQKKIAGGALRHWLPLLLGGVYLKSKIEDKSMLSTAVSEVTNGHGLVDDLGLATLGADKYDALSKELGRLYDKGKDGVSFVGGEVSNAYGAGKDLFGKIGNEFGDLYDFGKNKVIGYNGMVTDGSGQYVDPSVEQYQTLQSYLQQNPEAAELLKQHPELAMQLMQQQRQGQYGGGAAQVAGNMASSAVSGINQLLGHVSGGNVQKMDIASLMLSGLLFFGRFGWLGKIASAAVAGMTLKNVNSRQPQTMQPSQDNSLQVLNALLKSQGNAQSQGTYEESTTPVVHRGVRL